MWCVFCHGGQIQIVWICIIFVQFIGLVSTSERPQLSYKEDGISDHDEHYASYQRIQNVVDKDKIILIAKVHLREPETLEVECVATYPIEWRITGYYAQRSTRYISGSIDINKHENYTGRKIRFRFDAFSLFAGGDENYYLGYNDEVLLRVKEGRDNRFMTAIKISCAKIGDSFTQSSMDIFVPGMNNALIENGKTTIIYDDFIIPCRTSNPTIPVQLYKTSDNGSKEILMDHEYQPVTGFVLKKPINANLTCETNSTVPEIVFVNSIVTKDYKINPRTDNIFLLSTEKVFLECSSLNPNTSSVALSISSHYDVNVEGNDTHLILTPKSGATNERSYILVNCNIKGTFNRVWVWTIKFEDAPELYLDQSTGIASCFTKARERKIFFTQCKNPLDCEIKKGCFEKKDNSYGCDLLYSSYQTRWTKPILSKNPPQTSSCVSLNLKSVTSGIVVCDVKGIKSYFEVFTALDQHKYILGSYLPENLLLSIEELPNVLYTNDTTHFTCFGQNFLFVALRLSIIYQNGSEIFDDKFYQKSEHNLLQELNQMLIKEIYLKLPVQAVGIKCYAYWWNSSTELSVQKQFLTKHKILPHIMQDKSVENFTVGDTFRILTCIGETGPDVFYNWFHNGTKLIFPALSDALINMKRYNETSILEFHEVDYSTGGNYVCEMENSMGKTNVTFTIYVYAPVEQETDEEISASGYFFLYLLGSLILVLCGLAIFGLFLYLKIKKNLGKLSSDEIEEFYNGKQDFQLKEMENVEDTELTAKLDFLPYDQKFEIPIEDIVNNDSVQVIGSGQFAIVIKTVLKTSLDKEMLVAVKIAKPSASKEIFKSFMSEIKLLSYTGRHENVVSFIGACTQGLESRKLYIVLEYCELGNLQNYLIENRCNFKQLSDSSHEVQLDTLQAISIELTEIDLLRWSMQIASGMDYLSQKSIIHADLAARNILLLNRYTAKVTDFGLSKKLYESIEYVKHSKNCPMPWPWMALESLITRKFTKQSDVWSYGVILWEIYTLGQTPFTNEKWDKIFISKLESGLRLEQPENCDSQIYVIMVSCWTADPKARPLFSDLKIILQKLYEEILSQNQVAYSVVLN